METNIIYDCRWSAELDDKFISDFIKVENEVFGNGYNRKLFEKKYQKNIYGASVVEVVYMNGIPVAARGLWRNDIGGYEAYQPGDTCVTEACRGKGIFTEMTKRSIDMLPKDVIIYNFPNQNSYPGYIKMGWKLNRQYGFRIFTSTNKYLNEHPIKMDKAYYDWWVSENCDLCQMTRGKKLFLVRKMNRPCCYKICACVDEDVQLNLPRKPIGITFYRSEKQTFYNKKLGLMLRVVSREYNNDIPIWKIDVL